MSSAQRLRLALAWEEARIPALFVAMSLLLAGSYVPAIARLEAAAAITIAPLVAVGFALRSVWNESSSVRMLAFPVAAISAGAALVAIWSEAGPWHRPVTVILWAAAGCAALVQLFAARRGARAFFAVGIGVVIALGLVVPHHVDVAEHPASVLGALLVAIVAGGGAGAIAVAIGERVAPQRAR